MQFSAVPDPDDRRSLSDSIAEGFGSDEDEDVEYEEIEVEVEEDEEEEEEVEEEMEVEEDMEIEEEEEVEEEEEEEVEEEEEEEIDEELSDSPIDLKDDQFTRHEENLRPDSVNAEIATETAPVAYLEHESLIAKPETSSVDEIRQKEDPSVININGCSNMKQHLAFQGSGLQTFAGENKNSEAMQEREESRDDTVDEGVQTSLYGCRQNMVANAIDPLPSSVGVVNSAIFRNEGLFKESYAVMGLSAKVQPMSTHSGLQVCEIRPRSSSPAAEFKDGNKRSTLPCDFFALGWCIKGRLCAFRHVEDHPYAIEQKSKGTVESNMDKKELQAIANGDTRDGFGRSGSSEFSNAAVPPVAHGSFILERIPSIEHGGSTTQHQFSENTLSFQRQDSTLMKDTTGFVPSDASRSMGPNFHRMSTVTQSDFHFNPSELKEYKSTVNNIDSFKLEVPPYNWEPSVPFQPTFSITRSLLRGSLYDPICDHVEKQMLSGTSYRPEITISNSHENRDVDNRFPNTVDPQSGSERNISSKHHSFSNNLSNKNIDGRELFLNEKEDTSSSHAGPQKVSFVKDEKTSGISIKDKGGDMTSKDDTKRPIIEMAVGERKNNDQELKIQKYFREALVEFTKELVKPTWREGRLTKTVHKVIVKCTVEKFLSTIKKIEFPRTEDSVKQYLSARQPTLSKLVAGYIIKYGNS
ncbi:uncharacterized protein LOC124911103 [Impatiens glandulifera]|uniref:uncharacterized protein LOC124911103 n=1 Tax=Impatiens glandulifera TaxID=253017 RepID=UPI001FB05EC9|nr:uncharacterized protein LOC124911103 [Impatiens glandulifera]